jgi:hypothetical protein
MAQVFLIYLATATRQAGFVCAKPDYQEDKNYETGNSHHQAI